MALREVVGEIYDSSGLRSQLMTDCPVIDRLEKMAEMADHLSLMGFDRRKRFGCDYSAAYDGRVGQEFYDDPRGRLVSGGIENALIKSCRTVDKDQPTEHKSVTMRAPDVSGEKTIYVTLDLYLLKEEAREEGAEEASAEGAGTEEPAESE
jgi:hypothetical protein